MREKLKQRGRINGANILPSDSEEINKVLPSGEVGIMIELGNINMDPDKTFLKDTDNIAKSIYLGIQNYYIK